MDQTQTKEIEFQKEEVKHDIISKGIDSRDSVRNACNSDSLDGQKAQTDVTIEKHDSQNTCETHLPSHVRMYEELFWKPLLKQLKEDLLTDSQAHSWYKHLPFPNVPMSRRHVLVVRFGEYIKDHQKDKTPNKFHFWIEIESKQTKGNTVVNTNCFWRGVEQKKGGWMPAGTVCNVPNKLDEWWEKTNPEEYKDYRKQKGYEKTRPALVALFAREREKTETEVINDVSVRLQETFDCLCTLFQEVPELAVNLMGFIWPTVLDRSFYIEEEKRRRRYENKNTTAAPTNP